MKKGNKYVKFKVRPDGKLPVEIYDKLSYLVSKYGDWYGFTTVRYDKKSKIGKITDRSKDVDESVKVAIAASEIREALISFASQADQSSQNGEEILAILSYLLSFFNSLKYDSCNQNNAEIFR